MSLSIIHSRALRGIEAPCVQVEVHLSRGLPKLSIVGLPEMAVKESKERVRSAIINSGYEFPVSNIIVNLAPADLPKEGGRFDLPIAIGILCASGQINLDPQLLSEYEMAGELALNGDLRAIEGSISFAIQTKKIGKKLLLPKRNMLEAQLIRESCLYAADDLKSVVMHLNKEKSLSIRSTMMLLEDAQNKKVSPDLDYNVVKGQSHAKRAMEIAAAGGHNVLMSGPPGSGKTMISERILGILPDLDESEALESAALSSIKGAFRVENFFKRPYRAPHHSSSSAALVGGGAPPKPGEISLAHHGILFLDELPEFDRSVLEVLREPLEAGEIRISRANHTALFPAKFQLIAAMNPCPCGYLGARSKKCRDSRYQIERYQSKISGPLLDRIDLHVQVFEVPYEKMQNQKGILVSESSVDIKKRVIKARELQKRRQGDLNARLSVLALENHCRLAEMPSVFLEHTAKRFHLSARAIHKVIKVARTISDLSEEIEISTQSLTEALSYRKLGF